jgi:hypothetical protein
MAAPAGGIVNKGGVSVQKAMELETLRKKMWDLYLTGEYSMTEVGAQLGGMSKQRVHYNLKVCLTRAEDHNINKAKLWLRREVLKCNYGEAECWGTAIEAERAWRRSIGKVTKTTKKVRPKLKAQQEGAAPQEVMSPAEATIVEEEKAGDPRFLLVKLEAMSQARMWAARRQKLLGLEKPKKIEISTPSADDVSAMTDDQLKAELESAIHLLGKLSGSSSLLPSGGNGNGNGSHGPN